MTTKTLILYYSWSGTTNKLAKLLQQNTNADMIELKVPEDTFSDDMYQTSDIAKAQLANNELPKLTNQLPNLNDYDLLLVGGPVWSGNVSTPVRSFLGQLGNYQGKLAPFYTDAGSAGVYEDDFQKLTQGHSVLSGLGLTSGELNQQSVTAWISKLN